MRPWTLRLIQLWFLRKCPPENGDLHKQNPISGAFFLWEKTGSVFKTVASTSEVQINNTHILPSRFQMQHLEVNKPMKLQKQKQNCLQKHIKPRTPWVCQRWCLCVCSATIYHQTSYSLIAWVPLVTNKMLQMQKKAKYLMEEKGRPRTGRNTTLLWGKIVLALGKKICCVGSLFENCHALAIDKENGVLQIFFNCIRNWWGVWAGKNIIALGVQL